ncbi:MAG: hypothetical protein VCC36_00630 [Gammaproteobacteria bacterium]|jgi:hypothetical protein
MAKDTRLERRPYANPAEQYAKTQMIYPRSGDASLPGYLIDG